VYYSGNTFTPIASMDRPVGRKEEKRKGRRR
jgi:hypothetical protein